MTVFNRLFEESTKSKNKKSNYLLEEIKKEEENKWKLSLAAKCELVDSNSNLKSEKIVISSLSSHGINKKRRQSTNIDSKYILDHSQRRSVSVILSEDGKISSTNNYIVTDSIEPTPYSAFKVSKVSSRFFLKNIEDEENIPTPKTKKIRKELNRIKSMPIVWQSSTRESVSPMPLDPTEESKIKKHNLDNNIMINMNDNVTLESETNPVPMISTTGICYDNYGYPTSLSFILNSK